MVKMKDFGDKGLQIVIEKLISEDVSKKWLKDILLQKTFHASHHSRDLSLAEFFDRYIWDNLTEEQQKEVVESLNLIIEEDLLTNKLHMHNYSFHLLDFAIMLNSKLPGKINSEPFLLWKEKDYPNLTQPIDHN